MCDQDVADDEDDPALRILYSVKRRLGVDEEFEPGGEDPVPSVQERRNLEASAAGCTNEPKAIVAPSHHQAPCHPSPSGSSAEAVTVLPSRGPSAVARHGE